MKKALVVSLAAVVLLLGSAATGAEEDISAKTAAEWQKLPQGERARYGRIIYRGMWRTCPPHPVFSAERVTEAVDAGATAETAAGRGGATTVSDLAFSFVKELGCR
jgi:hypothetical protein